LHFRPYPMLLRLPSQADLRSIICIGCLLIWGVFSL
jgi:hypothetical protein